MPCSTGPSQWAAAWAIGAEPRPASLENALRRRPQTTACRIVMPAAPPRMARGANAAVKISLNAFPTPPMLPKMTMSVIRMYATLINGMSFSVTAPMRLMPPNSTSAVSSARPMPSAQRSSTCPPKSGFTAHTASVTEPTMEFACDILPMPNAASAASTLNAPASHFHLGPMPFLI